MLTDFLYEYSICITTSVKGQKYMFQEIKPCKNCCWVKFKLPYNASVLLIDSDLLSICGIRWTPEKSGFQVARCIAVHSNNFLYDMKANWYPKKRFRAETKRCFFGGALSCFRGTATYYYLPPPGRCHYHNGNISSIGSQWSSCSSHWCTSTHVSIEDLPILSPNFFGNSFQYFSIFLPIFPLMCQ